MKKCLLVLLSALLIFPSAGCERKNPVETSSAVTSSTVQHKNLVLTVGCEPRTMDPVYVKSAEDATLVLHGFEGLTSLDNRNIPVLTQAESYALSEDQMTYTFTLRDGLKWSDGEAVTAYDYVYAWQRAIHPDTASDNAYLFEIIQGYDEALDLGSDQAPEERSIDTTKLGVLATDVKTLIVHLKTPCAYFLELCSLPAFYPVRKDVVQREDWASSEKNYISNGPYLMKAWEHNAYILFEKNPYYWNLSSLGPETIKFVLPSDETSALTAFQKGEVSFVDQVPREEISQLKNKKSYYQNGQLGTGYIAFDTTQAPFDNADVRRALTLALDREALCNTVVQNGQTPAEAFIPPDLNDADGTARFRDIGGAYYSLDDPEGNVAQAKELLAKAGYPNGEGFPSFVLQVEDDVDDRNLCEAIKAMWKETLQIDCTILIGENKGFWWDFAGEESQQANAVFVDYDALFQSPLAFLDNFMTQSVNNVAGWSNETYDSLLAQAKAETDQSKSYTLMHQAEDLLFQEMALCPIYYATDAYLMEPYLEGFYTSPFGHKYFMNVR